MLKKPPLKILIIRLSSLGDIIHSSVILKPIKKKYPYASISWLSEKKNQIILSTFKELDKIYILNENLHLLNFPSRIKDFFKQIKILRSEKFDVVIDIQGLLKSGLLSFLSGVKIRIGFSRSNSREFSHIFYNKQISTKHINNIFLKNLKLLEGINIKNLTLKNCFPTFTVKSSNLIIDDYFKKNPSSKKILLNPWSSFKNKNLPIRNLNLIIKKINLFYQTQPYIIFSQKNEQKKLKKIKNANFFTVPQIDLLSLIYLINQVDLYIGVDSGPSYISFFLRKETYILFGPTNAQRQAPPNQFPFLKTIYSQYQCPVIKSAPIKTAYRCLNKNCLNNLCMKKIKPNDLIWK